MLVLYIFYYKPSNISNTDFDILIREFAKNKKQNLVMKDLQELIQVCLESMMVWNPHGIDYLLRYQEIITAYNNEQPYKRGYQGNQKSSGGSSGED